MRFRKSSAAAIRRPSGFGALFVFASVALTFWSLSLSEATSRLHATLLSGLCITTGATLTLLGLACRQIVRLEDRVRELEGRTPRAPQQPQAGT